MFSFPSSSISIVRKKGNEYIQESITTEPVLSGTRLSPEENRRRVIARLRKDPTVFIVMEPVDGRCEEIALHPSGFEFHVIVEEKGAPRASLRVTYKDTLAYEADYPEEGENPDEDFDPEEAVLERVTIILDDIENGFYGFVMDSCPYFERREPAEPINLTEATYLLEKEGYQVERLTTIGYACEPALFVSENDIVLLGSRHFYGDELFLEMKRCYYLASDSAIDAAIKTADKSDYPVTTIHWEDGSWSFRTSLDDVDSENFLELLGEALSFLRGYISIVESAPQIENAPWDTTQTCRHFFIHETLLESLKLSKLNI